MLEQLASIPKPILSHHSDDNNNEIASMNSKLNNLENRLDSNGPNADLSQKLDAYMEKLSEIPGEPKNSCTNIDEIVKEAATITIEDENPSTSNGSNDNELNSNARARGLKKFYEFILRLKWSNIFYLTILHIAFVFGCIRAATHPVKAYTAAAAVAIGFLSGIGMSVGAHRYWAHRSFKAKPLLRLALMLLQTMTMNGSIFSYSRDHRNHHKYSDTEADPKNPSKGLFHAHVGWWLRKKSPIVIMMGRKFDVSDLWNDRLVRFQHQYYIPLFVLVSIVLPTIVPWLIWNENLLTSFSVMFLIRVTVVLHLLFCVNSVAHHYGNRPYDFRIRPADSRFINYLSMGEGNHNYHHVFPYDYRSVNTASWEYFDPISAFIEAAKLFGLAYDCKRASPRVIEGIVRRKGIPAHFDKKRSFTFRVFNACFDWICGTIVSLWILYPFIIYKAFTGQEIIILSFAPY